jgi:uncharacterized 2Fe-2S/4Fe-4S cluster protein (DUF4445 family)
MDENKARVIFQPYGIRGEVSKGVSVIEAARCLGVGIESIWGGNAAGDGCRAALLSVKKHREADWCSLNVEYIELTLEPEFEREFMEVLQVTHMRDDYPHLEGIVRPEILHQGIKTSK